MNRYQAPAAWSSWTLGDLTESTRPICYGVLKPGEPDGNGIPLIRVSDISSNEFNATNLVRISRSLDEEFRRSRLKGGELLLSIQGTIGRVAVCPEQYAGANISRTIAVIDPDPRVHRRFAYHFLRYLGEIGAFHTVGTTRSSLNIETLRQTAVPTPPQPEQRRIADVLDRAEALRAKRRAALAEVEALPQAIFLEMFGYPSSNPKGWPLVRFETICDRVTVGIVVRPASYYVSEGVPALRSLNIKPGQIALQDLVYFSKSDNEMKLGKSRLRAGDLVLVRSGQPGTAAVVPQELDGVNAIDLLIATPSMGQVDATFLCEFFNSSGGRGLVLSRQRGQVQKHLNVGSLNEATIPLPPIGLQRDFSRRVAAAEKLKASHRSSLAELDAFFASLQHRAFRGEL